MGISTPKPPFNLAEFLATPAPAHTRKKPKWHRRPPTPEVKAEDDTPETPPRA